MCSSRLLILGFVSILEIGSATSTVHRQTYFRPPLLQYPQVPVFFANKNSWIPQLYNSPITVQQIMNPTPNYYRNKKINRWMDPIRYKKPKLPKRLKHERKSNKMYLTDNWNYEVNDEKNLQFYDLPSTYLEPPKSTKNDYQYYQKSRKNSVNQKRKKNKPIINDPEDHKPHDDNDEGIEDNDRPTYIRDHAPEQKIDESNDIESEDSEESSPEKSNDLSNSLESPKDRIEFHIQGHEGPETYVFGFDTGDGNNRQYRLEERHEDGTVTGHYGYIDARGKLRKVRYKASPTEGYVEKHHENNDKEV